MQQHLACPGQPISRPSVTLRLSLAVPAAETAMLPGCEASQGSQPPPPMCLHPVCLWALHRCCCLASGVVPAVTALDFQAVGTPSVRVDIGRSDPCFTQEETGPREKGLNQGHPVRAWACWGPSVRALIHSFLREILNLSRQIHHTSQQCRTDWLL